MTETETRTQKQAKEARKLAMAELHAVKWVASQATVKRVYDGIKPRYQTLRQTAILGWFLVIYEAVAVWWWTFVHNLPWPQALLALLEKVDSRVVAILDLAQQKIEWWWDASGVRLMWLRESILTTLDTYLTKIDSFLLRVQDAVIIAITFLLKPVVRIYRRIVPATKRDAASRPRRRDERESDLNEDEDTEFGEDYLSDASTDSRRLLKSGGHIRQANGGASSATLRRLFPGLLSKVGKGARDSGDDEAFAGGMEYQQDAPRQDTVSRTGSLRRLPRFFASSSERKEEPANSVDAFRESSPKGSKSSLYQQQPTVSKPYGSPAVIRADAISPTGSAGESPGASPERRRRVFGRFSSKRQRPGK